MTRGLIYTAVFGGKDEPRKVMRREPDVDYVYLSDVEVSPKLGWETRAVPMKTGCPRKEARYWKTIMPFKIRETHDWCLWMDGSHINTVPLKKIIETVWLKDHDFALPKHPKRICAYKEAIVCAHNNNKDTKENVDKAVAILKEFKHPKDCGLHATGIMARKINPVTVSHALVWTKVVQETSFRDQITFDCLVRNCGGRVFDIPGSCYTNKYFDFAGHKK